MILLYLFCTAKSQKIKARGVKSQVDQRQGSLLEIQNFYKLIL